MRRIYREEFVDSVKTVEGYYEIFSNPTSKEMREVSGSYGDRVVIRFIADNAMKILYVFDPEYLHEDALTFLGLPIRDTIRFLKGVAVKIGGKWETEGISLPYMHVDVMINEDWSWVNKWINVEDDLNERRGK